MPDEAYQNNQVQSQVEIKLWPGVIAGIPVLLFGMAFILGNLIGAQPESQPWLLFTADGLVLLGLLIGLLGWFPDWAYSFVGMAALFSLWWSTATAGTDSLLAGAMAWSPLLLAVALGILLTRSLRPLLKFVQGLLRDWSLASLGLYGILPVAMYAAMSMMPPAKAILYQILAVFLMAVGAGTAGLAIQPRTRWRVLLLGMSWSWIVVTLGVAIYWHGSLSQSGRQAYGWFDQVLGLSLIWVILAMFVFFPAGFAMLGQLARRMTQPEPEGGEKGR